jgi:pheromone shutdown protein TraB
MGSKFGEPGKEFSVAVKEAQRVARKGTRCSVVFGDRDIRTTLLRCWTALSFWQKMWLLGDVLSSLDVTAVRDLSFLLLLRASFSDFGFGILGGS